MLKITNGHLISPANVIDAVTDVYMANPIAVRMAVMPSMAITGQLNSSTTQRQV